MRRTGFLLASLLLLSVWTAGAAEPPVAVSPGSAMGALVESRCPTFSWGEVEGAKSYELLVYRLREEGEKAEPVIRETFAGSVSGWTPSLDRCMVRGGRYAWSVRSLGEKSASEWSAPSLFEVSSGPSEAEFEAALQIVQQYVADVGVEVSQNSGGFASDEAQTPNSGTLGPQPVGIPAPLALVPGDSALQVNGSAVVTVATLAGAICSTTELRYLDKGNGTVLDCNTGLIWLKNATCFSFGTWSEAQAYAAGLNNGECGLTDGSSPGEWRLPTCSEFCSAWSEGTLHPCPPGAAWNSLVDSSVGPPVVVNATGDGVHTYEDPFVGMNQVFYWSATEINADVACLVSLSNGNVSLGQKELNILPAWPVRSGQ